MSLRVAVVGAGPAGIYASDLLLKNTDVDITVDLFEQMPAPFGLIRYGVAPDHPRIKGIVKSLHQVMDKEGLRLIGNVTVGRDITVQELTELYDAVVFSTGAVRDRELLIPGGERSIGAGEFVGFYDGNPRFERSWDLSAKEVAVVGVGNVALDISRVLAKTGEELLVTEIPDNVYETLRDNKAEVVHMFGRRGPAQAKFTPKELRELDESPTIQVLVDPEDIDYDALSEEVRRADKSVDLVCNVLESYAMREPDDAPHKIYIHFFENPVEVLTEGEGENTRIVGIRTERQELDGEGGIRATGQFTDWPVQQVYHAVGYRSEPVEGVPFDFERHVIPNDGGHVLSDGTVTGADAELTGAGAGEAAGEPQPVDKLYVTGWVKRGPVGLIGNTKSDAKETTDMLVADALAGRLAAPTTDDPDAVLELLKSRGVNYATWDGWYRLDEAERAAGAECATNPRERKKFVEWEDMLAHTTHTKG
ncbi:FAD-dependent oxidoreductase [Corynebacterium aquatimens]|uniref:FAD-dependent oxidoreductase n=1 Tax=Corynebacterium TaxID=1716 RepID=UPI001F1F3135|nr:MULTISPECIES: FAD-dependent oxidoreductase [Corynebacterium]QYH20521.1 FAD-dependent oxidoreductase [Corynebacterium aquatimens]UIZ91983.1 FAD-dependent oxidoreductase [Corynebacterium sp. CNCTC7651]